MIAREMLTHVIRHAPGPKGSELQGESPYSWDLSNFIRDKHRLIYTTRCYNPSSDSSQSLSSCSFPAKAS